MSNVFPKWTNRLPLLVLVGGLLLGGGAVTGVSYYFTPKYTRVGYQPVQPVSFSHKVHAGELGLDCRYCHDKVEESWFSNLPTASTCMNCHDSVLKDDPRLEPIRVSYFGEDTNRDGKLDKEEDKNGNGENDRQPVPWVQIHKTPDYVYFDHSVHVTRGISCVKCHGRVDEMDEVRHAKSLSMAFCLDCHRNAHDNIRPLGKVTDLDWHGGNDFVGATDGKKLMEKLDVKARESCTACHR
ncbi:MAG: cytochrome C [Verrucomicrobiales bacterium]|nr:cytochrome C [Verrucomicrobiales bacterium]MBR90885.1 cytochrome C [Verrucomicrobiales bacterium]|tara:strand:+ start:17071 stop:17790 length:720 start_codon:yes stop_codon:yes gene_type:complete